MAIVVSSLTSETVDPVQMARWAYEHGYWCSKSGTYHTLISGAAQAWGLSVEGCTASEPQRILDALADGKLVVALMTKGHFTKSGHFIVLRGVQNEKDPRSRPRQLPAQSKSLGLVHHSERGQQTSGCRRAFLDHRLKLLTNIARDTSSLRCLSNNATMK